MKHFLHMLLLIPLLFVCAAVFIVAFTTLVIWDWIKK